MELATIEVPQQTAREKYLEYRREVRRARAAGAAPATIDQDLARAYRAMSKGAKLIRLSETIAAGGFEEVSWDNPTGRGMAITRTLPKLAVARADARYGWCLGIEVDGSVEFRGKRELHPSNRRDRVVLPARTFPDAAEGEHRVTDTWWRARVRSLMPIIPPPLRPADSLGNYHVLWEAEWEIETPPAPVDPALLKHVGGDLYAVVAVWDLTELERAVLADRG